MRKSSVICIGGEVVLIIKLLLTLAVGTLGGLIFSKFKVPAGMLVGAIFAVSLLSVATSHALMPLSAKTAAQIITGAYIGSTIQKRDLLHLPRIIGPYLVMMTGFFVLNVLSGLLIHLVSPLDLLTALLCAMPGGVSDTPLIALDMGADAAKVAVLQFVRMVFGIGALPLLIVVVDRVIYKRPQTAAASPQTAAPQADLSQVDHPPQTSSPPAPAPRRQSAGKPPNAAAALTVTLLVATVGGLLGRWSGVPAGAMAFSMLFTVGFKMLYTETYLPLWCRRVAQVLSGCCIGSQMTYNDVLEIRYLLLPAFILVVGYFAYCVVMGYLLHRCFKTPGVEAMLSVAPAGATEMALISADMGVNSPDLIVLQLCRLFGVMTVFPQLINLLITLIT